MSSETEDPKPRWTDLIGIDPDYTDGRPVDEWLEANRAGLKTKRVYGMEPNPYHLTPDEMDISWAGLMELLDEHWPTDLFPTLEDDPERDSGARIVSLLRWVDRLRTAQKITCAHPATAEEATQFLARMTEAAKHAPITYGVPNSSEFGAKAAIQRFIARSRFKR